MRTRITALLFFSFLSAVAAQENYITREGFIKFYSHTPVEDITADNHAVGCILNTGTGEVVITLRMTDFEFDKQLMQRHFNDKFVESDKYPKATFRGFVSDNDKVNYKTPGIYRVSVEGDMTIHGVTRSIKHPGTIRVGNDRIIAESEFYLDPRNYDISIPKLLRNKIAEEMQITVELALEPMDQ